MSSHHRAAWLAAIILHSAFCILHSQEPLAALPVLHQGRIKPYAVAAEEVVLATTGRPAFGPTATGPAGVRLAPAAPQPAPALLWAWMREPEAWRPRPLLYVPFIPLQAKLGLAGQWATLAEIDAAGAVLGAAVMKRRRLQSGVAETWSALDEAAYQTAGRQQELDDALMGRAIELAPLAPDEAHERWTLGPLLTALAAQPDAGRAWRARLRELAQRPEAERADALRRADIWLTAEDLLWRPDPLLAGAPPLLAGVLAAGGALAAAPPDAARVQALAAALRAAGEARVASLRHLGVESVAAYPTAGSLALELAYRAARPFTWAGLLFLAGGILTALALARSAPPPSSPLPPPRGAVAGATWRLGLAATVLATLLCAAGLAVRFQISGWGAVTNLYETLVYVAALCGLLGLAAAWWSRTPALAVAAGIGGALCAGVGEAMPPDLGAHLGQLQPVLRSRLWLFVHVKVIVAAYAAFVLAWVLGNWALWRAARARRAVAADEALPIYRCLQVGLVLAAAGTLLGGVWAAQAWGRFWGWDPKEVWALVIILVYLVPLHLRYAGAVGPTGLAAWAVYGFLSVVMSWYGVNFLLGAGLHAYATGGGGFGSGGQWIVLPLCAAQVAFAAWGQARAGAVGGRRA